MKFNCIKCEKFICELDLRKSENKDEHVLYCEDCTKKKLEHTRELFSKKGNNNKKMKSEEQKINEEIDELFRNPYMRKTIIDLGIGKGRIYKFMTKMREGHKSMDEVVEFVRKFYKKFEEAEKKIRNKPNEKKNIQKPKQLGKRPKAKRPVEKHNSKRHSRQRNKIN